MDVAELMLGQLSSALSEEEKHRRWLRCLEMRLPRAAAASERGHAEYEGRIYRAVEKTNTLR